MYKRWINWLIPLKLDLHYLIEDLDNHTTITNGLFEIPFKNIDAATVIKFHINGLELPNNEGQINITLN